MELKNLINTYKKLEEEIKEKQLFSELVLKKIYALAEQELNKTTKIYFDIIEGEKNFKEYSGLKKIKNLEFGNDNYSKSKIINFEYKEKKYKLRIPYGINSEVIEVENILNEEYKKIVLFTKEYNAIYFDNIIDCFKYLKEIKND